MSDGGGTYWGAWRFVVIIVVIAPLLLLLLLIIVVVVIGIAIQKASMDSSIAQMRTTPRGVGHWWLSHQLARGTGR